MLCVQCNNKNTKCVDDLLSIITIAEVFECNDCGGTIEVDYAYKGMIGGKSVQHIISYKYTSKDDDDSPREICDVCRQNKHSTYSDNLKQHMCEDCWDSYGEQCHLGLA